jgi:predicted dinucleotide-binding enzyme
MQIDILGTGNVEQTLARGWSAAGHRIRLGSRNPASKGALDAAVMSLEAAVADNEIVVNATPGSASLELAEGIGGGRFAGVRERREPRRERPSSICTAAA